MHFIIQMVLFFAICVAVFPGLSANPIENRELAQVTRNEDDDDKFGFGCSSWPFCWWGKSNDFSPECRKCASHCETTSCVKTPELDLSETPECKKCADDCRNNVCKL